MVEIDEMICVDSSGDWDRRQRFQALSGILEPRTYGAAAISIFG